MKLTPYITFNGNCREAISFYEKVFGTKPAIMQTYGEAPADTGNFPKGDKDLILHSMMDIEGEILMLADFPKSFKINVGNNVTLCLSMKSKDKMKEIFTALSKGGKVKIPLDKVFFSELYGMVEDKFGIVWQIIAEEKK